ncbi:HK97 gp10 family phage protein [Shinella sp.]|uniref:HK97 gp10 family phage protein n=1 Tax=Shinella sp. TaxID=1870904 RepID=UPI0039E4775D
MALQAKIVGREALSRRLAQLAPNVEKYAADAKYEIAQEAAERMRDAAPRGATLEYAESIDGDFLRNRPGAHALTGANGTKDPSAAGIFAMFIWRFLEFGTSGHPIKPKLAKMLAFTGKDGEQVFVKGVKHPGSRAHPHLFPIWRAFRPQARRKLLAAVNRGVREAMKK